MADIKTIDAPAPIDDSAARVLARYGHLEGRAFEAAVRYEAMPSGTPLSIDIIRQLLRVGRHIAARVLGELIAGGLAAGRRLRDGVTGRMAGRRTDWIGPRVAGRGAADRVEEPPEGVAAAHDEAFALLCSLGDVDPRLAFRERDLRTLVPLVVDRLAAGWTVAELRRTLTRDLPRGRRIRTGFLHYRLTNATRSGHGSTTAAVPAARQSPPRLVECAECGRPNRDLAPGDLCRECRAASDPRAVGAIELPDHLAARLVRSGGPEVG
ncbi:hypothetical protein [Embleya sp. AB8]|uniref:hypothetical protein n=1 Tax=Embleya sp. AB8 TaxID=3156304 RepID=UPI003C771C05